MNVFEKYAPEINLMVGWALQNSWGENVIEAVHVGLNLQHIEVCEALGQYESHPLPKEVVVGFQVFWEALTSLIHSLVDSHKKIARLKRNGRIEFVILCFKL